MTDLNPTDLHVIPYHGPHGMPLDVWCRCTECGGTQVSGSQPSGALRCERCKDTDGWEPGRVRAWCMRHDSKMQVRHCEREPFADNCEPGWVPRIGVLGGNGD